MRFFVRYNKVAKPFKNAFSSILLKLLEDQSTFIPVTVKTWFPWADTFASENASPDKFSAVKDPFGFKESWELRIGTSLVSSKACRRLGCITSWPSFKDKLLHLLFIRRRVPADSARPTICLLPCRYCCFNHYDEPTARQAASEFKNFRFRGC